MNTHSPLSLYYLVIKQIKTSFTGMFQASLLFSIKFYYMSYNSCYFRISMTAQVHTKEPIQVESTNRKTDAYLISGKHWYLCCSSKFLGISLKTSKPCIDAIDTGLITEKQLLLNSTEPKTMGRDTNMYEAA